MRKNKIKSKYVVLVVLTVGGLSVPMLAKNTVLMDNVSAQVKGITDMPVVELSQSSISLEAGETIPDWITYVSKVTDSTGNNLTVEEAATNLIIDDSSLNIDGDSTTVDNIIPGSYDVIYTIKDPVLPLKQSTATMTVTVSNPIPKINLNESSTTLEKGDSYLFDTNIISVDDSLYTIDNSDVNIDFSNVDKDGNGIVSDGDQSGVVTYSVLDGASQEGTATLNVTINGLVEIALPTITLTSESIDVSVGQDMVWTDYLDTVVDIADNPIDFSEVLIDATQVDSDGDNKIDAGLEGTSKVVDFSVKDPSDASLIGHASLTVNILEEAGSVDTVDPILTLSESQIEVEEGAMVDESQWKSYIDTVSDETATLTQDDVTIDRSSVDTDSNGTIDVPAKPLAYNVIYSVTDGTNTTEETLKVKVNAPAIVDTTAPTITLNETSIEVEEGQQMTLSDWQNYISSVEDDIDGTMDKSLVEIDATQVDTTSNGFIDVPASETPYMVIYKATDEAGNEGFATLDVTVKEKDITPPVITLSETDIEVEEGATIRTADWKNYISSVEDEVDGTINKNDVSVDALTVDSNKDAIIDAAPNTTPYTVTYSVKDQAGNEGIATLGVTVVESTKNPENPVITLTTNNITISESQEVSQNDWKSYIDKLSDNNDDLTLANVEVDTSSVDTDGNGIIDVPAGDYTVTYTVKDSEGNSSTATLNVTVKAQAVEGTPIITLKSNYITLSSGDSVNWVDYLLEAKAVDGSNLNSTVTVDSSQVDSNSDGVIDEDLTSGDYEVIYSVTDPIRGTGLTGTAILKVKIVKGSTTDPISNLSISKTATDTTGTKKLLGLIRTGNGQVSEGETLNYQIELTNGSSEDLFDIVVEDIIDTTDVTGITNVQVDGKSNPILGGFSLSGNDLTLNKIEAGATVTITYDATAASSFTDTTPIVNTVNITSTSMGSIDIADQPTSSASLPKEVDITDTNAPTLDLNTEAITVFVGDTKTLSDWQAYIANVSDDIASLTIDDVDINVTEVDTNEDGIIDAPASTRPYTVTYSVTDGTNITEKELAVKVEQHSVNAPVITFTTDKVEVESGATVSKAEWKSYISSINDDVDTLTIADVDVDVSQVDSDVDGVIDAAPGMYQIEYNAVDSDGNIGTYYLTVEVMTPVITTPDVNIVKTVTDTAGSSRLFGMIRSGDGVVSTDETLNYKVEVTNNETMPLTDVVILDTPDVDDIATISNVKLDGATTGFTVASNQITVDTIPASSTVTITYDATAASSFEDTTPINNVVAITEISSGMIDTSEQPTSTVSIAKDTGVDVDTQDPIIVLKTTSINVFEGDVKSVNDWKLYIDKVIDNVDSLTIADVDVDVSQVDADSDGTIDAIPGTYSVIYKVEDAAGNVGVAELQVNVLEKVAGAPEIVLDTNKIDLSQGDIVTSEEWKTHVVSIIDDKDSLDTTDVTIDTIQVDSDSDEMIDALPGLYEVTYSVTDSDGNTGYAILEVEVLVNAAAPVINLNTPITTFTQGDTVTLSDWKAYVDSIEDDTDTLTQDDLVIDASQVDGDNDDTIDATAGLYEVTYSVTDSDGNTGYATLYVKILSSVDSEAPVLTLKSNQINVDEGAIKTRSDWQSYIDTVSDNIDDLTIADVTIDVTAVDSDIDGTIDALASSTPYNVVYSVSDSAGNTTEAILEVIVGEVNIDAPTILLDTNRIQVTQGDTISEEEWQNHIVSVLDIVDGEMDPKDVMIDITNVDTDEDGTIDASPGIYEVTYSITDSDGNEARTILEVEVVAPTTTVPDLSITKTVEDTEGVVKLFGLIKNGDNKVSTGETLKYTVEVTNNSSELFEDVVIEDIIDEDDTVDISNLIVDGSTYSTNSLDQITIDEIPAGATITITYDVQAVNEFVDNTDVTNTVNVMATSLGLIDVDDQPTSTATISKDVEVSGDTEAPVITLKSYNKTVYKGDTVTESVWKDYIVDVEDNVDTLTADDVVVTTTEVDADSDDVIDADAGDYVVEYAVSDAAGNVGKQEINVKVLERDPSAPVINLATDKVTVTQGDTISVIDWKNYIDSIDDDKDTLTIADVTIDVTAVDSNTDGIIDATPGIYEVVYSVTDNDGNIGESYLTVEVLANMNAPVINLDKTSITVVEGDTVTDQQWKDNILSVTDPSGSVGVDDVIIDTTSVDNNTDGVIDAMPSEIPYLVSYTVENDLGYTAKKDVSVIVKSKEETEGTPTITLNPTEITVKKGDTVSKIAWKSYIESVDDDKDTLTIADVNVNALEVDADENGIIEADPGLYKVIYSVTDSDGNEGTAVLGVTVVSDEVVNPVAPVITLFNNRITLEINTTLPTEEDFRKNIKTIEDDVDTLTSDDVTIDSSDVAMDTLGTYTVVYSVTDSDGNEGVENLTVEVVSEGTIPKIYLTKNNIEVEENQEVDWKSYIDHVEDDIDTLDNSDVKIDATKVDSDSDGKVDAVASDTPYEVVYSVQDTLGYIGTSILEVTVVDEDGNGNGGGNGGGNGQDNIAPNIDLYDYNMTFKLGDNQPNYKENIKSVTDNEDGTMSKDVVTIDSSDVKMDKVGEYTVLYSAKDKAGNVGKSTLTIKVVDSSVNSNEDPYINLRYDKVVLYKNQSEPNWSKYIVTAGDKQDFNLGKSDVEITDNVDTSKTGNYKVHYSLTDSDNNTTVEDLDVKVVTAGSDELTNTNNTSFIMFVLTILGGLFILVNPKLKK